MQVRKIYHHYLIQIHSILSIIVVGELKNVSLPNVMDCRLGRSNHSDIQHQFNTSNHKWTITEIA